MKTIHKHLIYILTFLFFILSVNQLYAQEDSDKFLETKHKIKQLQKNKDVLAINKIINSNGSLETEYALNTLNENLKTAKQKDNSQEIADTYLSLGNFWFFQGNKTKAYENYFECESISKRNNDLPKVGLAIMNRAILVEETQNRIELYKEAIEILKKTDDLVGLAKAHLNSGNAYSVHIFEKDSSDISINGVIVSNYKKKAFEHYTSADSINQLLKNSTIAAGVNVYTAEWYKYEKNYTNARKYFKKAAQNFTDAGYTKGEIKCLIDLAWIDKEENLIPQSLQLLKKAEDISSKYKFNDYLIAIYQEYVSIYAASNDYKNAFHYQQLYTSKMNEMNEQNSKDKIHLLNLEHNISENEYKVEKYQAQSQLNRLLLIFSILVTIAVVGISYLIIKNKKRKIDSIQKNKVISDLEKSAVEIKLKNQILEDELLKEKVKFSQNHLMLFANQVNKIDAFLTTLKNEMKGSFPEKQDKINSLKISFSEVLNNQNELKQLNSLSSQLNQEFFFYLRQNHPTISKEDEQLLSYIILDMGGKEISHNLNISQESVYKKRYRLRKKLNIPNEDSFINFYEKITQKLTTKPD